jgi:CDP-diacylglycerol--glycerol-3-phosphate 3-phosphatidyltransferase
MLDNERTRSIAAHIVDPIAKGLLRIGLSASAVTVLGSIGSVLVSALLIAQGRFVFAFVLMVPLAGADLLDGTMARISGTSGPWGSFLDSTTDRITDGAIFAAFVWWALDESPLLAVVAMVALVAGFVTSYARAKAESLGIDCKVGVAERPERVGGIMTAALLAGLGVPFVLPATIWLLALLSSITVWQRMAVVHKALV